MKTPNDKKRAKRAKMIVDSMGAGARAVYLEKHPHGFAANHKVHTSKKTYNRRSKGQEQD